MTRRLEHAGFVRRSPSTEDKRAFLTEATPPVAAEFSFKYGDDEEDYRGSVARDAHDVLRAIHADLGDWVHPEPSTKTMFVYG